MVQAAVAVGDNCIDHYLPPINQSFVGGNAVNVAVALKRHGLAAAYVGAVGTDERGRWTLSALAGEGLDVSHVQVLPGLTGYTDVAVRDGDRIMMLEELGAMRDFKLDAASFAFIAAHELVHNTRAGQTVDYLPAFKAEGLAVSFDYSQKPGATLLEATLPYVDLAFFSLPGADHPRAEELIRSLVGRGPQVFVVTMGAAGSLAFDGSRFYRQAAVPVPKVVDTLGAGDAFIGTFLAGWLEGRPLEAILGQAAVCAAETCTYLGGWTQTPRSEAV